jgi:uncharacterized protein YicC (UPF0701 family)
VVARAAGLDVHKQTVVATVRTPERRETRTFGTMTAELERLAAWLHEQGVTHVAMESTGSFWVPLYNILEDQAPAFELVVANAQQVKAVPGRKTAVKDSAWRCDLLRHGLLRGSFIPDKEHRERRELVRTRKALIRARAQEVNRVQKRLEGAHSKLVAVATDVLGVSGRQMLAALVAGSTDPVALAALAKGKLTRKPAALEQALTGLVGEHQRFVLREQLGHSDDLDARSTRLSAELEDRLRPFAAALDALDVMRQREGEALARDLSARLDAVDEGGHELARLAPLQVDAVRERLTARIGELTRGVPVDPTRIAQEVALFADRTDVAEETSRLAAHLDGFADLVRTGAEGAGRRLEFVVQEMGRETNTIGSKAGDVETSRHVVEIKGTLEKIRELVQNIE